MGLTKDGFKRKTYEDLLNDMSNRAKEKFGQDANVSERSVLGIIIRIMAWFLSLVWQEVEQTYHSGYRKTAEGKQLDMLLPFAGITRRMAEHAYGEVQFTGDPDTVIPAGFIVSTVKDIRFITMEDVTINSQGTAMARIVSEEPGSKWNVDPRTITEIVNPVNGVESVINELQVTEGKDVETDAEARIRADLTVEGLGSGTASSIRSELLKTPNVRAARIVENHSDYIDQFGTPSRAIQVFVLGGEDQDIAKAIHKKKSAGIQAFGQNYMEVSDASSSPQRIGFTRASVLNVYARIHLTVDNVFPDTGVDQVKDSLVQYIGGIASNGQMFAGLNMGDRVVNAKATHNIFSVEGVSDITLHLSADGASYNDGNINTSFHQVAQINASNIEVVVQNV